jgi:hypothetical protein
LEKAVVLSLPTGTPAPNEPQIRSQIHATLSKLDEGLARFESQILTFIEHLVGDPQYPYVAAENSAEMSAQIAGIEKNFDSLYTAFDLEQRTDVRAAQASLGCSRCTVCARWSNSGSDSAKRVSISSIDQRTVLEAAIAVATAVSTGVFIGGSAGHASQRDIARL